MEAHKAHRRRWALRAVLEKRQHQPKWLPALVLIVSVAAAFGLMALLLLATGHSVAGTYKTLFSSSFVGAGAWASTLTFATPLVLTGLAVAAAFRMRLYNIGGEGQLYMGAVGAMGAGLALSNQPSAVAIAGMCLAGAATGAAWAFLPGLPKALNGTSEIIVSLMLNYVAGLILNYLIIDSHSYWQDPAQPAFPSSKALPDSAVWPAVGTRLVVPLGMFIGLGLAAGLWWLYRHTRFGAAVQIIGDSRQAARHKSIRTRGMILAVMCLSGAFAGLGGASLVGDFSHQLDATGLQQSNFGYTGIVVAALARYNPFGTCLVALLLGGIQNAGFSLQGASFPSGLVGIMSGLILFTVLGGEVFVQNKVKWARRRFAFKQEVISE